MADYSVTVLPPYGTGTLLDSVSVTDTWEIAVEIAMHCVQRYPVRYAEYEVEIRAAANVQVYAHWRVRGEQDGTRTVSGGFLNGADREHEPATV